MAEPLRLKTPPPLVFNKDTSSRRNYPGFRNTKENDSETSESHSLTSSLEFLQKEELNTYDDSNSLQSFCKVPIFSEEDDNKLEKSDETTVKRIRSYLQKIKLDGKKRQKLFRDLTVVLKDLLEEEKENERDRCHEKLDDSDMNENEKQSRKLADKVAKNTTNNNLEEDELSTNLTEWTNSSFEDKTNPNRTYEATSFATSSEYSKINNSSIPLMKEIKPQLPPKFRWQDRSTGKNNITCKDSERIIDDNRKFETPITYRNPELSVLSLSKQCKSFYHIGKNILSINTDTASSNYPTESKGKTPVIIRIEPKDAKANIKSITRFEINQYYPEENISNLENFSVRNVFRPESKGQSNIFLLRPDREPIQEVDRVEPLPYKSINKQSSVIFPINKILNACEGENKPTLFAIPASENLQGKKVSENGATVLISPSPQDIHKLSIENPSQRKWVEIAEKIAESLPPSGKEQPMIIVFPPDVNYMNEEMEDDEESIENAQPLVFMSSLSEMIQQGETIDDFSYIHAVSEIPTVIVVPSKSQHTIVKVDAEKSRIPIIQNTPEYEIGLENPRKHTLQNNPHYPIDIEYNKLPLIMKAPEYSLGAPNVTDDSTQNTKSDVECVSAPNSKQVPGCPLSTSVHFDSSGLPPLKIEIGRNSKGKKIRSRKDRNVSSSNLTYGEKLSELCKFNLALAAVEEGIEETFDDCLMVALNQKRDQKAPLPERLILQNGK